MSKTTDARRRTAEQRARDTARGFEMLRLNATADVVQNQILGFELLGKARGDRRARVRHDARKTLEARRQRAV